MLNVSTVVDIVLKRRWWIIVPFMLAMIAGIYLAIVLPKIYESTTVIVVRAQRVPSNYVRALVNEDLTVRLDAIYQQLLSRTHLEGIINKLNLFSGPAFQNMFIEDKVALMRKKINVRIAEDIKGRKNRVDSFSISFRAANPVIAMKVVNELGNFFIEENLKSREAQASGTSDFLEEELLSLRKHLEILDEKIKNYREHYMGALPEQLETNLRILDRLQTQMTSKQEVLIDAKNRLVLLEKQITVEETQPKEDNLLQENNVGTFSRSARLNQMREQLLNLNAKYTDRHPDVIRLVREIEDLENSHAADETQPEPKYTRLADPNRLNANLRKNEQKQLLVRQREELKSEISSLNLENSKLVEQIQLYQKRVEDTPKREQELSSLKRDYTNVKATYDSLLTRQLEAKLAVNMEKKQKGEQLRIIDPGKLPTKPIEPDMTKLFLMTILVGLGIGGGLVFLFENMDTSFKGSDDIESYFGLPLLATIPLLDQQRRKVRQKLNIILSGVFTLFSLVLLTGFAILSLKGVDQTLEVLKRYVQL